MIPQCGSVKADGDALTFEGDCAVVFVLAARTNYRMHYPDYRDAAADPAALAVQDANAAAAKQYSMLARRHGEDYHPLFGRVKLDLGAAVTKLPTDRLRAGIRRRQCAAPTARSSSSTSTTAATC